MIEWVTCSQKKLLQIYQIAEKGLDKWVANVVKLLDENSMKIATAESCTGGLLSERITSISGASNVFEMGVCTYSERIKTKLLGVPAEVIAQEGVVSAAVACGMSEGLRESSGADMCMSVTGIAGPGGGTADQPVGTVFATVTLGDRGWILPLQLYRYGLKDRDEIRHAVATCCFRMASEILMTGGTGNG